MIRVYVAGAYNASNVTNVLDNMRRGMQMGVKVLKAGFAPFVPWFDYQFSLLDDSITLQNYYDYSLAWLKASDAVLVLPNSEKSKGTQDEIKRARELGIPVFYSFDELCMMYSKTKTE